MTFLRLENVVVAEGEQLLGVEGQVFESGLNRVAKVTTRLLQALLEVP